MKFINSAYFFNTIILKPIFNVKSIPKIKSKLDITLSALLNQKSYVFLRTVNRFLNSSRSTKVSQKLLNKLLLNVT